MKRTPWYPASVRPVRDGLYEWRCHSIFFRGVIARRRWTRGGWNALKPCPQCQWRGLTQPSEDSEK